MRAPLLLLPLLGCPPGWNDTGDTADTAGDTDGADCDGADLRVPADHPTIQAAIDAAVDGDVICVSPGTYVETVDFGGKAIAVVGAAGRDAMILDGGGAAPVVRFRNGETAASVLTGFTVTGGVDFWTDGAGIYVHDASPTLTDLAVTGNRCEDYYSCDGAGLHIEGGAP